MPPAGQHFRAFSHFKHLPFSLGSFPALWRAWRNTVKPPAVFCNGFSQLLQQSSSSSGQAAGTHSTPEPKCHNLSSSATATAYPKMEGNTWVTFGATCLPPLVKLVAESDFTSLRGKQIQPNKTPLLFTIGKAT